MVEFVPFDPNVHMKEFYKMNVEYMTWVFTELDRNYQIDSLAMMGMSIQEIVDNTIESFLGLKPPEGILFMAEVEGKIAGMGALTQLNDDTGEIKRMYNRPQYRGRGLGKQMLNKLLETGRKYGYTSFMLDTPKWAHAAQHIYKSAGFKEIEEYPESQIPPEYRQYWMFMEKKEQNP
jgi:ribosomal protein S18 acetylase RimI-like enzyme